jgi:hypothetical protein
VNETIRETRLNVPEAFSETQLSEGHELVEVRKATDSLIAAMNRSDAVELVVRKELHYLRQEPIARQPCIFLPPHEKRMQDERIARRIVTAANRP